MVINTIQTQEQAIANVRLSRFIIASVDSNGAWSVAQRPVPHTTASEVRAECKRLAKVNPGKMFVFVELSGAELVPSNTVSI